MSNIIISVILKFNLWLVSQDPCLDGNTMMLDHMTKRSTSYAMDSSSPLCDRYITETWYRPIGYVMATSPPSLTFCGTLYPVWMSGIAVCLNEVSLILKPRTHFYLKKSSLCIYTSYRTLSSRWSKRDLDCL